MRATRSLAAAALAALACAPPAAAQGEAPPARWETVGRAAVGTRTTGLAVYRGRDGRDYALTGTLGACSGCRGERVYVWDLGDPARPTLVDSVAVDARVVADVAVNAEGTLAVATRQQSRSRRDGMVVLDLADPAHPRIAADYFETVTGGVLNAAIDGRHAYVVNAGTADMHVIDLSDPADPREVGRWGLRDRPDRHLQDVAVRDGLAYLSYWDDGLVILDVGKGVEGGSPERPALVGRFLYRTERDGREIGNTSTAVPHTNRAGRAYVFVGDKIFPGSLDLNRPVETAGRVHVLDVSRPSAPVEVARWEVPGAGVAALAVRGDTLYAAFHNGGLRALDVSGELRGELRSQGRELAALVTEDGRGFRAGLPFTLEVQPHGDLVYAADLNSGLWAARLVPAP
ncbi:MAG TPA: PQQ-binding-like beta-propeller repeat protein [Longimicrobiaceae bacterium]|nr:PQQ-binding-like beta-propeller repeat protein [Longimicrobiaceae bacterium]